MLPNRFTPQAMQYLQQPLNNVSILKNIFTHHTIYHGYLPAEFMKTAIVPFIKCKIGNSSDKNNY